MPEEPKLIALVRSWFAPRVESRATPGSEATLDTLATGQRGTVARLTLEDARDARKLMALGVLPGTELELERRRGGVVVRAGFTRIALDDTLAHAVVVRVA